MHQDDTVPDELDDAIAIVGLSGRFPGAADVRSFWRNLCDGVESVTFFTDEELASAGVPESVYRQPNYVAAKASMAGVNDFDAEFFGYNAHEAGVTDPQQRVFLECAWEALEDAGYDSLRFPGRIGVYGGVSFNSHLLRAVAKDPQNLGRIMADLQALVANEKDSLTTRVAYKLDLRGPAVTVQTACSTSLVAVHLACQALLGGECDMALAGGAGMRGEDPEGYLRTEGMALSADGHCRPFDAGATGTVNGGGAGVVVLRRLADAVEAGDPIHAVVRGSAINNDGGSGKAGFTAPSVAGQAQVVADALAVSGVPAGTIGFVEAHGTGTVVGDPIEVTALTQVFRQDTDEIGYCVLGSVKANIGHLDAASGVAGLIKATLAVREGVIPPMLHFAEPNPKLGLESSPFTVNTEPVRWNAEPRRAGVSSLGVGGTNAHVVLEQPPPRRPSGPARPWQVVPVSARSPLALEEASQRLAAALEDTRGAAEFADAAHTLQVGRRRFAHRRTIVCRTAGQAAAALRGDAPELRMTTHQRDTQRTVVFLFPGGGTQYVGMAGELYRDEPVFAEHLDQCAEFARYRLGYDLREVVRATDRTDPVAQERLATTAGRLGALFAVEYALARLWMSWGVRPKAMIGHSAGEYVAASLAGVFSVADAIDTVVLRGELIDALPPGGMLAVTLPEDRCVELAGPALDVAAVNGAEQTTLSGPIDEIRALQEKLTGLGVRSRLLHVWQAGHTRMLDDQLPAFAEHVRRLAPRPPEIAVGSNVTGGWLSPEQATSPEYWARQLREPVRFADNLRTACAEPDVAFVEAGPGHALSSLATERCRALDVADTSVVVPSMPGARDETSEGETLAKASAMLWLAGVDVDWAGVAGGQRVRVSVPTYPFQRRRYTFDSALDGPEPAGDGSGPSGHDRPSLPSEYVAPRTDLEVAVGAVWADLLGYRDVGVFDDFLLLGGDSLLIGRLVSRLREQFPVEFPLSTAFTERTIAGQAGVVEELLLAKLEELSDEEAQLMTEGLRQADEERSR